MFFSDRLVGVVHRLDPDQLSLKELERNVTLHQRLKKECLNIFGSFFPPDQHIHHHEDHLGDVEDDGEEEGGQDVDGQVDGGGGAPLQSR